MTDSSNSVVGSKGEDLLDNPNIAGDGNDEQFFDQDYSDIGYEYLDHPADVQIHSWGKTFSDVFEQAAIGMFGYMTDLNTVVHDREETVTATGHDLQSLLFNFLDECLFAFSAETFICACMVNITEFDLENFSVTATLGGETFDLSKHPQGTEVKAITYSNMQIFNKEDRYECYVIIDI